METLLIKQEQMGGHPLANPNAKVNLLACGYCGHLVLTHRRTTNGSFTSVWCARCPQTRKRMHRPCIIFRHRTRRIY